MRYYLGLDNGGTSTKAALFDTEGRQIGVEAAATDAITPAPGFVERDMDDMWQDNCRVIRALLEKTGINSRKIAGIGLCGHGKGLYLWGKDEQPVRRGILSADNRAWKYQMDWRTDGTEKAEPCMACAQANGGDADNWEPRRECKTCAHVTSTVDGFPCGGCSLNPDPGHGGDEDRWTWKDAPKEGMPC